MIKGKTADKPKFNDCLKLDIKALKSFGLFTSGKLNLFIGGVMISAEATQADSVLLRYNAGGKSYVYAIGVSKDVSTLGVGEIYYFICPVDGSRRTALYMPKSGGIFRSRSAYNMLYPSQLCGKAQRETVKAFRLSEKLARLQDMRADTTHRGNITARHSKTLKLEGELMKLQAVAMCRALIAVETEEAA